MGNDFMAEVIREVCASDDYVREIAQYLYTELSKPSPYKNKVRQRNLLSYPDLIRIYHSASGCMRNFDDEMNNAKIYVAIQVLCNPKVNFLELKYYFIDEYDDFHLLSINEVVDAERNRCLEHPLTGHLIADYKNHVFPFFSVKEKREFK